jgi:hypothetical protein
VINTSVIVFSINCIYSFYLANLIMPGVCLHKRPDTDEQSVASNLMEVWAELFQEDKTDLIISTPERFPRPESLPCSPSSPKWSHAKPFEPNSALIPV